MIEPSGKIGDDIGWGLQPNRHAYQLVTDASSLALIRADTRMRGRSRVSDGGLDVTQVRSDREHLGRINDLPGAVFAARDFKRYYRAKTALLARGEVVARMTGKPRVMNFSYCRVIHQPVSHLGRMVAMSTHAQRQGFQALEKNPGIERAHRRPSGTQGIEQHLVQCFVVSHQSTTNAAALAIEVLGRRMDNDVRPQGERLLQYWSAVHVIDRKQGAGLMRQRRQRRQVADIAQRVGGGFDKNQAGVRCDCLTPGRKIGQWNKIRNNPKAAENLGKQRHG